MTSERAEIFIRWTMSIVKLVNGEKIPKKYQGAMPLSLKVNTLELPIQQRAKCRKLKNGSNLPIFNVTGLRFCTPPMVHKNEQLLFFDQKISRPNQTAGGHFGFLGKMDFWTSAGRSSTTEWLPDPQKVPK